MKSKIITISILFLILVLALVIRLEPAKYGELDEYDPFWNYKATKYLVENGWDSYMEWYDEKSWYGNMCTDPDNPDPICTKGRNVSETSQVGLHLTTALLYDHWWSQAIFINDEAKDLYNFIIIVPAIFGALAVLPMYLLVQQLSKSKPAGLVGAFFFSITFSILMRNSAGWFKSEPLGLLLGLTFAALVTYLILNNDTKISIKITGSMIAGLVMTLSLASWIGSAILIFPVLIFGLLIPIVIKKTNHIGIVIGVMGFGSLIPMLIFERAVTLFLPLALVMMGVGFYIWASQRLNRKIKIVILVSVVILSIGGLTVSDVSERYKSSMLPFMNTDDKLVQSVSEHQLPTLQQFVYLQGFYIFLAPIGFILYMRRKNPVEKLWMFTLVGTLMYFGISLIRLQMIFSVAMIILSAIGTILILQELLKSKKDGRLKAMAFATVMIVSLTPFAIMWIDMSDTSPSILSGGTPYEKLTNEWLLATEFISELEPDAKIFSWWDYGYWISVLGDRTTYMDNATLYTVKIVEYAKIFAMTPADAHDELIKLDADYVLVYSTSYKENGETRLVAGGDELKASWIFNLAGKERGVFDNNFFTNTLLGAMIPFMVTENGQLIMVGKNIDGFELVYLSESYKLDEDGVRYGILIYKVLK